MCHNVLHTDSNKEQKELNPNINLEMFRLTVVSFWDNLTPNTEINVLRNRRPTWLFHQPITLFHQLITVLMLMDPVITGEKDFDHFIALLSVCWYKG